MKTLKCTLCNKEYKVDNYKADKSKFCSKECFDKRYSLVKLNKEEIQVILTGVFGDGNLHLTGNYHAYSTSSINKEYILYKQSFFKNLKIGPCTENLNGGYKKSTIFKFSTNSHPEVSAIKNDSVENNLYKLDDLGVALWFFDDGSLHQKKRFYNLNTHSFNLETHKDLFIPFFKDRYGIKATLAWDRKKDGRMFNYLRFNKNDGSFIINDLLSAHNLKCFNYKCWFRGHLEKE